MKQLMQMMKQAQELQGRMAEMQERLAQHEITGQAGGGLVRVTLNGKGEMQSISIDPSLIKPDEQVILQDLIVVAFRDAKGKLENFMAEQMAQMTGGMNLPAGLKLPF